MEIINTMHQDKSSVDHIQFSNVNDEQLYSCSQTSIRLLNVESNQILDEVKTPPKQISEMKVSESRGFLYLSTIHQ